MAPGDPINLSRNQQVVAVIVTAIIAVLVVVGIDVVANTRDKTAWSDDSCHKVYLIATDHYTHTPKQNADAWQAYDDHCR